MTKEEAYDNVEKTIEEYFEFKALVKRMREAQKVYLETFPTGYGCYAPVELEKEVDAFLDKQGL